MDSFGVKIKRNNRTYKAKAHIDRGMLTVHSGCMGTKSTCTSSNNRMLAGMLLREMVSDFEKNG